MAFDSSADELDTISFLAGHGVTRDSNLFRLPDNTDPFLLTGKHQRSDIITNSYVGLQADKLAGMQKLHFGSVYSVASYQNYSYLGTSTRNYNAGWQWALTPRLTGALSADSAQSIKDFSDYQGSSVQNIVTSDSRYLSADWSPLGNWHLFSSLSKGSWRNSQQYSQVGSSRYRTAEGGIRYAFPSGASMAALCRKAAGDYLNRSPDVATQLDSGYRQIDHEIALEWPVTGKSQLYARLGAMERTHPHFSSRDYAGKTGRLSYRQGVTGKVSITAAAERTYNSYQDSASSYYINDVESIQAAWAASSRLKFDIRYDAARRNYYGKAAPANSISRSDKVNTLALEIDWMPRKSVSLIGKTVKDRRRSTSAGLGYNGTATSLTLQIRL